MRILIAGGAGFIGSHACDYLLGRGHAVLAVDNFDPFYAPELKRRNLVEALANPNFKLVEHDCGDRLKMSKLMRDDKTEVVLYFVGAGSARQSAEAPMDHERANVSALVATLEAMKENNVKRIVFASSSSVYGHNPNVPFNEDMAGTITLSPYGATKRAAETMLRTYSNLYGVTCTILRLFSVFGPRQRPDMAISSFIRRMLTGQSITLYGRGEGGRAYTFISDVMDPLITAVEQIPPRFAIYNIGAERVLTLTELIRVLEKITDRFTKIVVSEPNPCELEWACPNIARAARALSFDPQVGYYSGLERTVQWVKETA
jgi:UDP-glucuronate 4-epimerase